MSKYQSFLTHNQALQLTVKSAAPIVALLFTASELDRYISTETGRIYV